MQEACLIDLRVGWLLLLADILLTEIVINFEQRYSSEVLMCSSTYS